MLTRLLSSAAILAALAVPPAAQAANFRWANDGDVGAMDPYTRQETVQLSFLSNIYEPLLRWNRELKLEPALAVSWGSGHVASGRDLLLWQAVEQVRLMTHREPDVAVMAAALPR